MAKRTFSVIGLDSRVVKLLERRKILGASYSAVLGVLLEHLDKCPCENDMHKMVKSGRAPGPEYYTIGVENDGSEQA